jgi:hypothetical protein
MTQRTDTQNKALHKFFSLLSDKLNEQGLEMPMVLKTSIWWTPYEVKERLWKPLQAKMYGKKSTTELDKTWEIDKIHEQLMQILGERCNVEYIDFPHDPEKPTNYQNKVV